MKPTSIRFNVSVLTKVWLHRQNPSAEKRNQQSVIYHKLEVTPSCSHEKITQCREQHQNWLQLRGTPLASNLSAPLAVPNSCILTTSLPTETTAPTVAVPKSGGPEKERNRRQSLLTWPRPTEFMSWKITLNSEVTDSSQCPRAAVLWTGEVDDAGSTDDLTT